MQGARGSAAACIVALVLVSCVPQVLARPPIEFSGEVGASVTTRQYPGARFDDEPGGDDRDLRTDVLAYTHVSTYLWRPWIATVSLDLNAAYESNSRWAVDEATALGGDLVLSVLPASPVPFEIFFSASDNRFDGDYSGADYRRLRAGVSGRALLSERTSLDYFFSHNEFDQDGYANLSAYGDLTAQRAEATLRHSFNPGEMPLSITDVGLSVHYYNTDYRSEWVQRRDYSSESLAGTVYYSAVPAERLDHDFSATLISENHTNSYDRFKRVSGQGVGTLQWRSPSNEIIATGAIRIRMQKSDHRQTVRDRDVKSTLMATNAGLSWRPNDNLSMSLGARASTEHIGTYGVNELDPYYEPSWTNYTGGILGSVDYRSDRHEFYGFDWHWDARAVGDLGYHSNRQKVRYYEALNGRHTDAQLIVGHTFERSVWLPWVESVNVSLLQETGFSHYSEDEDFWPIITHSASMSKGFAGENSSSYFRFYVRDTQSFGHDGHDYQTAQIDFTRQMQLTGNQSLHGSLGAQVVRQNYDHHRRRHDGQHNDDVHVFSRANVTYEYRDIFGIAGMTFSSDLRLNSIGLDNLALDWRDEFTADLFRNDWRNRLQYNIGQLSLSLEGSLFHVDDDFGHYLMFSGRRTFDYAE